MKIEKWPSRAKWGQAGPNRAKWCQAGSNGAKKFQKVAHGAKCGQKGQRCQTRPNGVICGGFFTCTHIFMRLKNHICNPSPQTKIGGAMGIFLIPRFWSGSSKTVVECLVLVRGIFSWDSSSRSPFVRAYVGPWVRGSMGLWVRNLVYL